VNYAMQHGAKTYLRTGIAEVVLAAIALSAPFAAAQDNPVHKQRETAIALEQAGKSAEAETAWRSVLKVQPTSAEACAHLGFLEGQQQRYAQAIPFYRKALALQPNMPGLRMNLGLALFKAGALKDAIRVFEVLLKQQPPSSAEAQRLKTLIGMSHYGLGQYVAAVPYLKQATANDPQNLPFRLLLAHSCLWSKQYQCVLDVYREILNLNAESAEADMLAGEASDEMQDRAGATQQFRAAVKANPKEPNVHFGLGYLLWTQAQYEEAAREFQAELANVPDNVQALTYLADTEIKLNHPETARPLLEKAVLINPRMGLAHLDLGIIEADAGNNEVALRELKLASQLSPTDINPHYRLARLYQAMGRKQEAAAEFAKTKALTKAANDSVFNQLKNARGTGQVAREADSNK
jgi:tetratricopeptide (TPR) repeat protein